MQSPIHIQDEKCTHKTYEPIKIKIDEIVSIFDTDTGLYYKLKGTSTLLNREFELNHLHFHTKSEHCISDEYFLIEAHFVNISEVGRLAVVAVFFKEGKHHDTFEDLLMNIHDKSKAANVTDFLKGKDYYHYLGSLTTPPLIENVEWYLIKDPIKISKDQYRRYLQHYPVKNSRNLQKINQRKILYFKKT